MSEVIPFRDRGGRERSVESSLLELLTERADLYRRILQENPSLEFASIPEDMEDRSDAALIKIITNPPSEEDLQGEDAERWVAAYRILEERAQKILLSGEDATESSAPFSAVEK